MAVERREAARAVALFAALGGAACIAQAGWIPLKAQLAQLLIGHAWERVKRGEPDARPWPWADTVPVARLIVAGPMPRRLFVLEGSSGRTLAFGPAHDPASVLPGERGNSVIGGHRDTSFRFLKSLKPGDLLQVERIDGVFWFVVSDAQVADSRLTRISLASRTPRLTLVTCYPFDAIAPGGPLRWVVTAEALNPPHR
jgi:sortase A